MINQWINIKQKVKSLPYGRNSNRSDFSLVLSEGKGSCSSKHAFLKSYADEHEIEGVELILAIYKMNSINTPGIGDVLKYSPLDYIPEAHCYLIEDEDKMDYTSEKSDIKRIEDSILLEMKIQPIQVVSDKIEIHKKFLQNWVRDEGLSLSFAEVWKLREQAIENLSKSG